MTQHTRPVPAARALGGAVAGMFFLAIFGTIWAFAGINALLGWDAPALPVLASLVGIFLLSGAIVLRRAMARLVSDGTGTTGRAQRPWFGIIVGTELISIAVAVVACHATQHPNLIGPLVALIVGMHFLPLAALLRVPAFYATGLLLVLISAVALVLIPPTVTLAGRRVQARLVVVCFGAAVLLWGTGISSWFRGRAALRQLRAQQRHTAAAGSAG